jgi:hypothetical protein
MMSKKLMLHAQELCEAQGPFVDTGEFLKAFREDRFPNFGPQCEVLYKNCFQKATESTRQYASRFKDICVGSSKDLNMFVDDFIKRMRTYTTKKAILTTLYDQGGRTLERVAHRAEQVEIYTELHQEPGERWNDRSNNKFFKQRSFGSRSQSRSPSRYHKEMRTVNVMEISCLKDAMLHDDIPIPAEEDGCKFL